MKGKVLKTIGIILIVAVSATTRCYFPWWSIPNVFVCIAAGITINHLWIRK